MKRNTFASLALVTGLVLLVSACKQSPPAEEPNVDPDNKQEENLKIATLYHELDPANVDLILTEDFQGRTEKDRHTWTREDHRNYLSNGNYKVDTIYQQVAQGDWVATRFARTMLWNDDTVTFHAMHFKRFEDGKIAEIWEYGDSRQAED